MQIKKQEKETDNSLDIIGSVDFVDDDALFLAWVLKMLSLKNAWLKWHE